jgi:hypothetical protein
MRQLFEAASKLRRSKQQKIAVVVEAFIVAQGLQPLKCGFSLAAQISPGKRSSEPRVCSLNRCAEMKRCLSGKVIR